MKKYEKFEVYLLSTNEYSAAEIIREEIPEKYFFDEQGELLLAFTIFNSENTVLQLITFLFQSREYVEEVYRDETAYILDVSLHKHRAISFEYLEAYYHKWIEHTKRENTMNEYGMLLDFIGLAKKYAYKKYLLISVFKRHKATE